MVRRLHRKGAGQVTYNGDIAQRLWEWKGITPRKGRIGGWKVTHPDLTTHVGFQWPSKGKVTAAGPFTEGDPCPSAPGDGLCVAVTFSGASSGGIPANGTGLLVEYVDVLGSDASKVRVAECWVGGVVDVCRAIREGALSGANLHRADLSRADLSRANLSGAYLSGAYLSGANLSGANLSGANLSGAYLSGAYLSRASADNRTRWPDGFDPTTAGVVVIR